MRDVLFTVLAMLLLTVVCFFGLLVRGGDMVSAAQVAMGLLGLTPFVVGEVREMRKWRGQRSGVVPTPEEYGLSPVVVLLAAPLALFAISHITSGLVGFGVDLAPLVLGDSGSPVPLERVLVLVLERAVVLMFAVLIVGVFFVCRWVGRRSRYDPVLVGGLSIVLYVLLEVGFQRLVFSLSPEKFPLPVIGPKHAPILVLILLPAALIGAWRGRKMRLQSCVAEALDIVPPDIQNELVSRVFEEARRYRHAALVGEGASESRGEGPSSPMVGAH